MKTKEAKAIGYVSRRFSKRSRRYKKLAGHVDDVEKPGSLSSKSHKENVRASMEDFDEFVLNRCRAKREAAKVNTVALDEVHETDKEKETLPPRCRRPAICEEMEKHIWNEAGVSLRGYREILVTRRLLYEMHLLWSGSWFARRWFKTFSNEVFSKVYKLIWVNRCFWGVRNKA